MRNLKKLLAVVLVVAVMLSTMATIAFADTTSISADAQSCATLGMLKGAGNGVDAAYTASLPTRIQAAILLLRMEGLEDAAANYTGTDNFSDVKAAWEKPYTAYLKAHPEVGFQGVGNNKLDPNSLIDAKAYYKVMLTALGYTIPDDYTWDNTISFAASKGLSKALDAKSFTIDTLATATIEALKANAKGSDKSLVATMAEKDAAFAAKATTAGIYTVDSTLKVSSVNFVDAKTVQIKFSVPVLKSTVVSGSDTLLGVSFTAVGGAPAITSASAGAVLSDDGKTLTVTPAGAEYFGGDYAITVATSITDVNANAIVAYSAVTTLKDTTRPTVTVSYPANGIARYTFSEPMNIANSAAVNAALSVVSPADGATAPSPSATLAADKKSFDLDISGYTTGKTYTVTLVGVADYAGNLIAPNPYTAAVVNQTVDSVKPTVTAQALDINKIQLTYSEKMSNYGTLNGVAISTTPLTGNATVDTTGLVVTATLPGAVPALNGVALVTLTGYSDLSGNTGDTYTKLMNFVTDTTAPTYVSNSIATIGADQYLLVKYNENVTIGAAPGSDALTGTYIDSTSITKAFTAVPIANASQYLPTVGQTTTDTIKIKITGLAAGTYTATIPGTVVDDLATAPNSAAAQTVTFSVGTFNDPTKPTVSNIYVQRDKTNSSNLEDAVYVVYSMDVTPATALNVSNYLVEGQSIFSSAIFDGDAHTVKLTLKPNVITVGGSRVMTIQNVATVAGKVMDTNTSAKNFVENVKPYLASAKFSSSTTITATFSENLAAGGSTNAFEVYVNGVKLTSGVSATATSAGSKDVVITVPSIDLTKTYQIKYVGTDFVDQATVANMAPQSGLVTVVN
ncbi:MAG: Ig-like domain-containing protein [Bacillota bacterium]|nr:Ig-like domain-containing protein [Bacillota bacterium]